MNCLVVADSDWDVDYWEIVLTESMNCSKYLKNWVDILERQLMRWSCQIPLTSIFFQIHLRIPSLSEPFLKTPFNSFLENVYTFQKCLHFTIWKDWFLQKFDFFLLHAQLNSGKLCQIWWIGWSAKISSLMVIKC